MFAQVLINGLVMGASIALMSTGLTLIFGILRIVNFWHGEAFMLGAVIVFFCAVKAKMGYILASFISIVCVGLLGWISDKLIFKRFHGNLMGGVIAAIACSMGFQNTAWIIFGPRPKSIPSVITGQLKIFGASLTMERLLIILVSLIAISGLGFLIKYTKLGKAMRAVQQDTEAAFTVGISVHKICALTFGIATALAALAGVVIAPLYSINPAMGATPLLFAFIVIIVGGMGSITGAFIASYIIGMQQSFTSTFWGPHVAMAASFGLAMIVLFFLPKGLMGHD